MKQPDFKFTPAKSSNISATAYDVASQTLAITFKGGKTYTYANVPPHIHAAMNKADSIGKFVGSNIVGKFKHTS